MPKGPRLGGQSYDSYNWMTYMDVRIAGDSLQADWAGNGVAASWNSATFPPFEPPADPGDLWVQPDPILTAHVQTHEEYGQMLDTFSTSTGELVRVIARVVVTQTSCEYRDVDIYVW